MNLLPAFIRNLFVKPSTNFVPETSAAPVFAGVKPVASTRRPRNAWVREEFLKFDERDRRVKIVKIPDHMNLDVARSDVSAFLIHNYGKGRFSTRLFRNARTIHVSAK